mmetsp:Transcript_110693/g.220043  ORF Transcript_110693/g.220043 Transcript_110693/m.220043 type:complete len:220 (+) Transcript_110693:2000-2659(+)
MGLEPSPATRSLRKGPKEAAASTSCPLRKKRIASPHMVSPITSPATAAGRATFFVFARLPSMSLPCESQPTKLDPSDVLKPKCMYPEEVMAFNRTFMPDVPAKPLNCTGRLPALRPPAVRCCNSDAASSFASAWLLACCTERNAADSTVVGMLAGTVNGRAPVAGTVDGLAPVTSAWEDDARARGGHGLLLQWPHVQRNRAASLRTREMRSAVYLSLTV